MSPDFTVAKQHGASVPQPPPPVPWDAQSSMKPQGLAFQGVCGSQPAVRQVPWVTLPAGAPDPSRRGAGGAAGLDEMLQDLMCIDYCLWWAIQMMNWVMLKGACSQPQ